MIKNTVLKQKYEKEEILKGIYIEREKITTAKKWLESDIIKVIIGPRRAGKSIFAFMLLKELPFMYFNFDDESLNLSEVLNTDELIKNLHEVYGNTKFVLFDEIQNLPRWELFANRLKREGYNITITGSNSKLLSKELSTALTGRHIPIEILPFNFKEFLKAKNYTFEEEYLSIPQKRGILLHLAEEYLLNGGFPEIAVKGFEPKEYLKTLFDSIIFKDVVKRYRVKHASEIDNIATYLINNFSNLLSFRSIQNFLSLKSVTTTEKYVKYLEESYIFFELSQYSSKASQRIKSPRKIYVVDNGYITAKSVRTSLDRGKMLENLIFTELIKNGKKPNTEFFYYKTRNGREVDFVIKDGLQINTLIQVSYDTTNIETEKREVKSLIEAQEELNAKELKVITWDEEKEVNINGTSIKFESILKFLFG
ncbi:ATP-binding protein [Caldisericum exile]|uniref:ATP-binding protein n=1 Tax=Caldisericum exile (strain DSM 21853 / NBRC 104410 / AZM16c01) TaxID=511051 RepID=A0A7U6GD66_CALEA|nr:ATP-binding protein [Caldisericum exile]BAL80155.1 hypothetical protein CSE_00290 [Caldisericum exile AZM16c01]